jgi:PHD/YefM family antitoxin component YafN of YafNO toxin-antitoxin module
MTTILNNREFAADVAAAQRAADSGPLLITDQGLPAYVLLRHDAYMALAGDDASGRAPAADWRQRMRTALSSAPLDQAFADRVIAGKTAQAAAWNERLKRLSPRSE